MNYIIWYGPIFVLLTVLPAQHIPTNYFRFLKFVFCFSSYESAFYFFIYCESQWPCHVSYWYSQTHHSCNPIYIYIPLFTTHYIWSL